MANPIAYETDPSKLTRQFKEIDPTVKSVTYSRPDKEYKVTYAGGTTNTLTPEGLANLQRKYILNPTYDSETLGYNYGTFYGAVTPEDIAKSSIGYVAPQQIAEEGAEAAPARIPIAPFTPSVPAFEYRGGAPYAGLAALPAPAPVSLIQMPASAPVLAPSVQTIGPGGPVAGMKRGGLASEARGLAALGRGEDSMLVHMSPQEVAGLQALALQTGTSLTINPNTGLPEALNLGKLLKSVLPAVAGYFLGPAGTGMFSSGVTAGLTVGGLTAAATGSLEKGLAAGLGAYGGFGLSEGVAAAGGEKELFKSLTSSAPDATTVGPSAGGVSAGTVDPTGTITGVAGEIPSPSELAQFQTQATGTPYYGTYVDAPTGGAIQAKTASAVVPPLDPVEAFNAKVGMPEYGSLYAGSVALPAAIEETEKFQRQQALLRAEEEDEKRRYRELFESTLGAVPTRMARSGGLMSLAGGGMTYMEAGGTTGPTGMPRDVTGTGDGMSDSVPATIEGVQEARLADGEFVIPADVVADIGNGSSDAGSKKLYDMMDRIRKARHGTTEQPPEIDAEALMPA